MPRLILTPRRVYRRACWAAWAVTRHGRSVPAAVKEDPMNRIAVAASAFGNTFTLPLVFLVEVLGASYGDRCVSFYFRMGN